MIELKLSENEQQQVYEVSDELLMLVELQQVEQ